MDARALSFFPWISIVVVAVVAWPLANDPALRSPGRMAALVTLLLTHLVLHWVLLRPWRDGAGRAAVLLASQSGLVLALGVLTGTPFVTLTLSLVLLGEVVGNLPRRPSLVAGLVLFALVAAHALLTRDRAGAWAVLGTALPTAAFVVVWVVLFQRQARERERAEQALAELDHAHARLAAYAGEVEVLTLTAERQRMARELHDTLAQGLAGLVLQLEAASVHLEHGDSGKVEAILAKTRERARATLAEARRAIDDLRRADTLGTSVAAALRLDVERFSDATGIPCALAIEEDLAVPEELATPTLRCVSECLANIARHAHARQVGITVRRRDHQLEVVVEDDGVGFDTSSMSRADGHYGLLGLSERARLAGGTLLVDSAAGRGTRVTLTMPLPDKPERVIS